MAPGAAPHIWINGFPATGKLTIAKEVHRLVPGSVLIDNHSLIDQVTLARDHPDYNAERAKVRSAAFTKWVHPATDDESDCGSKQDQLNHVVIFTDFLTVGKIGEEVSAAQKTAAEKAGRPFLPVYLSCSRDELMARLASPDRQAGTTTKLKLKDAKLVNEFLDDSTIYKFPGGIGLELEVTNMAPEEAARAIVSAMESM
ncbi:hypothetical protein VHEMI10210 [[Torrubiella] hemipterigena]|uniref:Uncharacterized protein n=1 Tax=[Torrubiella] hemipterigena TaxID=1531966 RepID=A0A0A1TRT8_9HYPO|nr:hypothetical protein VHEMI10210 [[Torrubiella] hemipterigena]